MSETTRTWVKDGLWAVVFAGLVASIIRFAGGLGAATGLNDSAPWGLWIAFKLVFVALAGGGFTLAAMVYVFRLERYRPILRRAILVALLGYGSFIVSLIFDLGLPWHIYMPVLNWQHHSVMFEIAWCVMLYFSVLVLEFSPVILEHPWFRRPLFGTLLRWLHRLTLPLIVAGIVLSTLHQSSLGSLFLIMPHRVHPLWYSPWLPYLFFTSAIAAGMTALIVEGFFVERWFGRGLDLDLLARLGRGAVLPLGLYLALRLGDLWLRGVLPAALDGSWQSFLFLAEIVAGGFLPIVLFNFGKVRRSREGLLTGAALVILGIVSQRMSLSLFTMYRAEGTRYVPSLGETLIAFAIPAAAALLYLLFAETLPLFGKQAQGPGKEAAAVSLPGAAAFSIQDTWGRGVAARRSGFAVIVIALLLPVLSLKAQTPEIPVTAAMGWEALTIDGNRSGYAVNFPHLEHQERLADGNAGESGCRDCHHLDLPGDRATACSACHAEYYRPVSIFDHNFHRQTLGGNGSCLECHDREEHTALSGTICLNCHEDMVPGEGQAAFSMAALPYKDAMHGRCLGCHEQQALAQSRPELALCSACHTLTGQSPVSFDDRGGPHEKDRIMHPLCPNRRLGVRVCAGPGAQAGLAVDDLPLAGLALQPAPGRGLPVAEQGRRATASYA
ncbi:MAG: NrfD/PsrC family molybdoenzyme membrane anchor subunit [Chloroflexota bacterium]